MDSENLMQVAGQTEKEVPSKRQNNLRVSSSQSRPVQPDGGWGWVVCFTSMACNGTVFGIINCFGIIYVAIREQYAANDPHVSFKTAWVGSVTTGITFSMCMLSSILSDRVGMRITGVIGGILAFIGILSSAFVEELMLLYLTYGVFMGIGFACSYAPSLVILGHYFKRHMGLVNGLVTFGSSVFTLGLALGLKPLLNIIGLKYTFLFLSGMVVLLIPYALTWKPIFTRDNLGASQAALSTMSLEVLHSQCADCCRFTRKFLNVKIWRNRGYVVWALSNGFSLFGYFVPFVHLVKYVEDVFPNDDGSILVMCIAITSGVSRIVFGKVADFKWVNRIRMQQLAFAILGIATLCIPFSESFGGLIAITLIMGLCDGVFICLLGPIAFDLVGESGASQAIGFLFGIFSIPMTVGPPVAGFMYDHLGSYNIAFHVAGCPPIIGAFLMFFIPRMERTVPAITSTEEFAAVSCHDIYHSKLGVEIDIEPPLRSIAPEVIVIKDANDLALLTELKDVNGDVSGNWQGREEEDIQDSGDQREANKEDRDRKSNNGEADKETDPMLPQIQEMDLES